IRRPKGAPPRKRRFQVILNAEGFPFASGSTRSLKVLVAALVEWFGQEAPGAADIAVRHPFLKADEFALAYERGRPTDYEWECLGRRWRCLAPIIERAAARPELRRLCPVVMWHGILLSFSRWLAYPPSEDLPCPGRQWGPPRRIGSRGWA